MLSTRASWTHRTRALLRAAGIGDPTAASPDALRRALAFTPAASVSPSAVEHPDELQELLERAPQGMWERQQNLSVLTARMSDEVARNLRREAEEAAIRRAGLELRNEAAACQALHLEPRSGESMNDYINAAAESAVASFDANRASYIAGLEAECVAAVAQSPATAAVEQPTATAAVAQPPATAAVAQPPAPAAAPAVTAAPAIAQLPAPAAVTPAIPIPVSLTACLQQAGNKRTAAGEGHQAAKKKSKENAWWCTCRPVWPPGPGRQWHDQECPRERFDRNGIKPTVGATVTCMQSAGPRAGQIWRCVRVDARGWERVLPEAMAVTAVEQ